MDYANKSRQNISGWTLHAVGIAALAFVLGAFYSFGYARLIEQGDDYAQRTEELGKLLKTLEEVRHEYQSLRQEFLGLEQAIVDMRARLPDEMSKEEFENDLRRASEETGFQLNDTEWHRPTSGASYSHAEVTVRGVGSFASICQLLDEVSQFTRLTKISQLQLDTGDKSDSYPLRVTFLLVYGVESHDTNMKGGIL